MCRLAVILNNVRSRVMPRWSNVYPGHCHRVLVPFHETILGTSKSTQNCGTGTGLFSTNLFT